MASTHLTEEQVAELRQAFDMFDRDRGGSISTKELGYTMRAMGMNPTEAEILDLLCEVMKLRKVVRMTSFYSV